MSDVSNYEKVKEDAANFYKMIGRVRCPALNDEYVHFTSEGFNHLIYKNERRERDRGVQIMKFKLLSKAKVLVSTSSTYQEYDESLREARRKQKKKVVSGTCVVRYWGFVAIIKDYRIKVVVRQLGNGQKHFWSVIPAWSKSHYKDIKLISKSKGNLEED